MNMSKFVAATAAALSALAFSHSASAVVLTSSSGANIVTNYSEAGVVSFRNRYTTARPGWLMLLV